MYTETEAMNLDNIDPLEVLTETFDSEDEKTILNNTKVEETNPHED